MFRRRLDALKYPLASTFDIGDERKIRLVISWLEDQRICRCEEDHPARVGLRDPSSPDWETSLNKYLIQLGGLPEQIDRNSTAEVLDWLLSTAIRLAYKQDANKYSKVRGSQQMMEQPKIIQANSLDKLDFGSREFIDGIRDLAKLLRVTNHPDHLVTFEAIATLVKSRMSTKVMQNLSEIKSKGEPWPFSEPDADMGFKSDDHVTDQASRILRLLYIHDIRDLQTKINECIVAVQTVSANPKTDAKLGKIGI